MRYVEAQGLRASVIGLGAWQFGSPEWGWGDGFGPAEAQAIVDRARQLGVTLIDTAATYGKGESERVLGHILARPEVRDSIVLASKVAPIWPTRDRVKVAAHASLERLGTDRLDLYQVHWPNPLVPQSSTMGACARCRPAGWSAMSASATTPWACGEPPRPRSAGRSSPTRSSTTCCAAGRSGSCWASPRGRAA